MNLPSRSDALWAGFWAVQYDMADHVGAFVSSLARGEWESAVFYEKESEDKAGKAIVLLVESRRARAAEVKRRGRK